MEDYIRNCYVGVCPLHNKRFPYCNDTECKYPTLRKKAEEAIAKEFAEEPIEPEEGIYW